MPRNSTERGGQRWYDWRQSRYYSVTTMTSEALRKRGIEYWGRKMVALGLIKNLDAIQAMLAMCESPETCRRARGELDLCVRCGATVKYLIDLPFQATERAKDIGTEMHSAIEAYTLGRPMPPWALAIRPRMHQFERFLHDFTPTFELTEATVYNRTEWYAGTLDTILTFPVERITALVLAELGVELAEGQADVRGLGDWKSSERGIYPEIALQLSAYRNAEFIGLPDGSEQPMPAVDFTFGLQITDETYNLIPVKTNEATFRAFIYAREMFRFADQTAKTVLAAPLIPVQRVEVVA